MVGKSLSFINDQLIYCVNVKKNFCWYKFALLWKKNNRFGNVYMHEGFSKLRENRMKLQVGPEILRAPCLPPPFFHG